MDSRGLILSTLQTEFIGNASSRHHYNVFLNAIQRDALFEAKNDSNVDDVVGKVHSCLNSSKSRLEGLLLFHRIIHQCSTDTFVRYVKTWASLLLSICQSRNSPMVHEMCYLNVGLMLQYASGFPEINRDFSSSLLPPLLTALLESKEPLIKPALKCLVYCIEYSPGPCGNCVSKIESVVTPYLDGTKQFTEVAGTVYAMLGRCGGGGNLGVKHMGAWTKNCLKLIGSLHQTLDLLYQDFETNTIDFEEQTVTLKLDSPPPNEPSRSSVLTTRFDALCQTLAKMLILHYSTPIKVPHRDVIALVCRTLALTPKQLLSRPTKEKIVLSAQLSGVHLHALSVLRALITCCKGHLTTHHRVINKCLLQSLSWSHCNDSSYGTSKPFSSLRTSIYDTIQVWIRTLGASCGIEMFSSELSEQLLHDIALHVDRFKGVEKKFDGYENAGKKKKKKSSAVFIDSLSVHRKLDISANSTVCQSALTVLIAVLECCGCYMKASDQKKIQEVTIQVALSFEGEPDTQSIPYGIPVSRKLLYEALLSTVKFPSIEWPPPTQCALRIFQRGVQDSNVTVSEFCLHALRVCEIIMHPRGPSFSAPISSTMAVSTQVKRRIDIEDDIHIAPLVEMNTAPFTARVISWDAGEKSLENRKEAVPELPNCDEELKVHTVEDNSDSECSVVIEESPPSVEMIDQSNVTSDVDGDSSGQISDSLAKPTLVQVTNDNMNTSPTWEDDIDLKVAEEINMNVDDQTKYIGQSSAKRKITESEEAGVAKKMQIKESTNEGMEDLMADFVNAEPDSD